jgi:hypothetical protein
VKTIPFDFQSLICDLCQAMLTESDSGNIDYTRGFLDGAAMMMADNASLMRQRLQACSAIGRMKSFNGLEDPAILDSMRAIQLQVTGMPSRRET